MNKEKPILFSTEMVRAILDGRKTQTRRLIKPQPILRDWQEEFDAPKLFQQDFSTTILHCTLLDKRNCIVRTSIKVPYQVGDTLWVRETWCAVADNDGEPEYLYRANYDDNQLQTFAELFGASYTWRPSIHMPREAARLFLRVTDVRAERLQEMSEEDAIAEGFPDLGVDADSPLERYSALWDKLYVTRTTLCNAWQNNPWVWVYTFERAEVTR
jgi:hypothetical protein